MAKTEMNRAMNQAIEDFQRAVQEHDRCASAQRCAKSNLDDAALLLARRMLPDDAARGEVYCCWVRIGEDETRLRVVWDRSDLGSVVYTVRLGDAPPIMAVTPPGSVDAEVRRG